MSPRKKVLLVGFDIASWGLIHPLLDQGKLPHLQSLVETGMMASLRTRRPLIDNIIYNSLATGKYADQHGVLGPQEVDPQGQIRYTDSLSRRVDAFWDIVSDNQLRCNVVNFPSTGPAEQINGTFVAPSFFQDTPGGIGSYFEVPRVSVYPETELESLVEFIVTLQDINAEVMSSLVPRFGELDAADPRLVLIGTSVAKAFSVHAVATHLMEHTEWDVMSVSYDILRELAGDFLRYHSPEGSPEKGSAENRFRIATHLFSDVLNSAILLCDRLLGRLLELAGKDTSIIVYSPRGVPSQKDLSLNDGDPNPTYLESIYRGEGIFLMRESGMPSDELLHEIGFLDLCPTTLHACGLQAQDTFDGCSVQSYLDNNAEAPKYRTGHRDDPGEVDAERIDLPSELLRPQTICFTEPFAEKKIRHVEEQNLWMLAAILFAANRHEETLPMLLHLYHANPVQATRGYLVADALYRSGHLQEAVALMQPLSVVYADIPVGQFMAGFVALNQGNLERAKEFFETAESNNPRFPILFYYLGQVYLLMDLPEHALRAFSRFLELDPCLPLAHLGLSESFLRLKRFEDAAESALTAVGADFSEPAMHLALGRAMAQLGENKRAQEAYETVLRISPGYKLAEDHLDWLAQYSDEAVRDPTIHTWRSLTPPLHPQLGGHSNQSEKIKEVLEEIRQSRSSYLDAMEKGENCLDEYLSENRPDNNSDEESSTTQDTNSISIDSASEHGWVVRPMELQDQAAIQQMSFSAPFSNPSEKEIFVSHPIGVRQLAGAVMLQWSLNDPEQLRMRFSLGDTIDEAAISREQIQLWLLRAALIRAAAGHAKQVKFTFRSQHQNASFQKLLFRFGFTEHNIQDLYRINSEETRDIGLGLLERYRKRNKVPSDIQLLSLNEVSFEEVDSFLRQWFADGVGDIPGELHPPECPVMVKGSQIIACAVGYIKDPDTFQVTRIGVLPEYRKRWATPWLLGGASKVSAEFGRPALEFMIDENLYADWIKIAKRHFHAKHIDTMRTMIHDLNGVWK